MIQGETTRGQPETPSIVVGAGPIGMYAASRLAESRQVVVFDADATSPEGTESRANFLRSLKPDAYPLQRSAPVRWHPRMQFRRGCRVARIDRRAKTVVTECGEWLPYHHLVLALGAEPVVPEFANVRLPGIQTAYNREDFDNIAAAAARGEHIAVIGGGPVAVELAANLVPKASVHLCARGQLLKRHTDDGMADRVGRHLRRLGVCVDTDCPVAGFEDGQGATAVCLCDGRRLVVDRVILACGLRPRTSLARQAGMRVADGICVDDTMRTSDEAIVAVGDCAESVTVEARGNVAFGIKAAENAVAALRGEDVATRFAGACAVQRIRVGEAELLSVRHESQSRAAWSRSFAKRQPRGVFTITLHGNRIAACRAFLAPEQVDRLSRLAEERTPLGWRMTLGLRAGLVPKPRTARDPVVCRCAGVRRSRILQVAGEKGGDLDAVAAATGASLYCGACVEQLSALAAGRPATPAIRTLGLAMLALLAVVAAAGAPTLAPGDRVQALAFKVFTLLTHDSIRQLSGYLSLALVAVALAVIGPRRRADPSRRRLRHVFYGALALAVLPLHVLGGITIGYGLNSVLVGLFVVCVMFGVAVLLKPSLRTGLWLHVTATIFLLAAIALHVVYIYQY